MPIVINEVDYDQPGADTASFIELFNNGPTAVSLAGLAVVLVNGGGIPGSGTEYLRFDLSVAGASLAAGQYLLIANTGTVTIPSGALSIAVGPADFIQNGPSDGIALINSTTNTLLDALSYEGSITAATITGFGEPVSLVEGTAFTGADNNNTLTSLSRIVDGLDSNNASQDWTFGTRVTPGLPNDQIPPSAPSAPDLAAVSDSGLSSTDKITKETLVTLTGTAEAGSTVRIFDTDGTTVVGTGVATGGAYSIIATLSANATHTLTAKATDSGGFTSVASGPLTVVVDTLAPVLSGFVIDNITSDNDIVFSELGGTIIVTGSIVGAQAGDTVGLAINGQVANIPVVDGTFSAGLNGLELATNSDLTITGQLSSVDVAGNVAVANASKSYTASVASTDTDSDGLTDLQEFRVRADPGDADTDDDGVIDGDEVLPDFDADADGFANVLDADSDGDGLFDGTERGIATRMPTPTWRPAISLPMPTRARPHLGC